jgi:hypothetical protein
LGLTIGAFAIIGSVLAGILPAVHADEVGKPNNSDQAKFIANGRFREKLVDLTLDDNHNNDTEIDMH